MPGACGAIPPSRSATVDGFADSENVDCTFQSSLTATRRLPKSGPWVETVETHGYHHNTVTRWTTARFISPPFVRQFLRREIHHRTVPDAKSAGLLTACSGGLILGMELKPSHRHSTVYCGGVGRTSPEPSRSLTTEQLLRRNLGRGRNPRRRSLGRRSPQAETGA